MSEDKRLKNLKYLKITFKETLNSYSSSVTTYINEQAKLEDTAHWYLSLHTEMNAKSLH